MPEQEKLLKVENLGVSFFLKDRTIRAVNGVSFNLERGEVLGIVGESGSGKSVTAMTIMRLIPSAKVMSGRILFDGEDLLNKTDQEMTRIRGNKISMIFQEPMTSLNPVHTIGSQIIEAIRLHQGKTKEEAKHITIKLLKEVGIPSPESRLKYYPHQLSGGMLQRAMIGMALSCNPSLLIADEPTTALDVTIQAQILDLLQKLKQERDMAIIMITHDLGVVAEFAKYIVVMYSGRVVEEAPVLPLFEKPLHPYTEGLLKSIPRLGISQRLYMIPSPKNREPINEGCCFYPRCEYAFEKCRLLEPPLMDIEGERKVGCWLRES